MNAEIIETRIRAVRRELKKKGIDCLVVTRPANVTYATGFLGDDSWTVITKGGVYLVTDSRYTEQAQKECLACKIIERTDSLAKAVAKIAGKKKSVHCWTVKGLSVRPVAAYAARKWSKTFTRLPVRSATV